MDQFFEWMGDHKLAVMSVTIGSAVAFVATLVATPAILVRIPRDYFTHERRPPGRWDDRHPLLRLTILIVRNVFGVLFILMGLAMLFLPGQGLLTILIGFLMLEFPAKYRLEKWLVSRRRIHASVNWLRKRRGRPPLAGAADAPAR